MNGETIASKLGMHFEIYKKGDGSFLWEKVKITGNIQEVKEYLAGFDKNYSNFANYIFDLQNKNERWGETVYTFRGTTKEIKEGRNAHKPETVRIKIMSKLVLLS